MTTGRKFRIHGPRGVIERAAAAATAAIAGGARRERTIASEVPITAIMSRHVVCASPDLPIGELADVMVGERLGCVPVVDEHGHPLGMVTKFDLVEQLVVRRDGRPALASDVMMPLAITLGDDTTVAHAAAIMASEDMHHVMIVSGRHLVGVVSTMDVTRWLFENDGMPRS